MPPSTSFTPRIHAVVPCAGRGERAGAALPKQYVEVAGRPVLAHALAALLDIERIVSVVVVVAADDTRIETAVAPLADARLRIARVGGASRAQSVGNGLRALRDAHADRDDWVLVHDAARCLLRPEWVERLIDACEGDAVGGLLALRVADTLKTSHEGRVVATLDRRDAWQAQTPQMFRLGALGDALARGGREVTDESSAIEASGVAPLLVPGDPENFKLTLPSDFALAERLLASRSQDAGGHA